MRNVTTYERFERHIRAWAAREVDCLAAVGSPGTGKTQAYRQELGQRPHHLFGGRKTPIQVYCELYDQGLHEKKGRGMGGAGRGKGARKSEDSTHESELF